MPFSFNNVSYTWFKSLVETHLYFLRRIKLSESYPFGWQKFEFRPHCKLAGFVCPNTNSCWILFSRQTLVDTHSLRNTHGCTTLCLPSLVILTLLLPRSKSSILFLHPSYLWYASLESLHIPKLYVLCRYTMHSMLSCFASYRFFCNNGLFVLYKILLIYYYSN